MRRMKSIGLKAPKEFVKGWIQDKYMPFLTKVTQDSGEYMRVDMLEVLHAY